MPECTKPIFTKFPAYVHYMGGNDQSNLLLAIAQGMLLWYLVTDFWLGANRRRLAYPTFILCAGVEELQHVCVR